MKSAITFVILAASAMCQSGSSQGGPCPLGVTWTSDASGGSLTLNVRNASSSAIRAYVVRVAFTNTSTGAVQGQFVRSGVKPMKDGKPTYLEVGQAIQSIKAIPVPRDTTGVLAKVNVDVDSVIFADGSQWGPGTLPQSVKVRGMIEAMDRGMASK